MYIEGVRIVLNSTEAVLYDSWFNVGFKTVNTCAFCRSFVSSFIASGGIIVFLCFILCDIAGDRFTPHMSLNLIT